MLVYYIGPMGFRSITYYLSNALICTVYILVAHFLYLYYTLISAYIKASICIVLFTKYNIEFQSLSLSLPLYVQHGIRATFLWPSLGNFQNPSALIGSW